jgi:hypothetical protein
MRRYLHTVLIATTGGIWGGQNISRPQSETSEKESIPSDSLRLPLYFREFFLENRMQFGSRRRFTHPPETAPGNQVSSPTVMDVWVNCHYHGATPFGRIFIAT